MKRKFTLLNAALALLALLALPMGMWGQTRTTQTAFYGFETGDAGWTATNFVTNNTAITAHGGSKYGATSGSTATLKYNNIVDSPQSLTCYVSKTSNNTTASTWYIQVSSNGTTWTNVSSQSATSMSKGEWVEFTADLSSYSDVYIQIKYDGSTAVRALDDITFTYDDGSTPSTDPEITFTPASITLGNVMVGDQASATITVSQANLTSDITLSVDNGSLSTSSITQGAAATTVTWTYTPTTAGAISATVTASSGTATETLAISGTAIAPVEGYDVDFEYATDMYPNWTFENMTTYQTGSITAHGGTYYGTTGGKATASITTTSTVANPGTLTCYVSKQSGNTTASTWYIQVSENGSNWTDVESQSASSMAQGSWVEFTANLTDYTDVYVRVYYNGTTAIRNIDDLTLTTVTPSPAVATTTTINVPVNFNTDIYQCTTAGTLTATVSAEGTPISGATVTWSSSNTGVATIDANGEVTLVAVGTTTITASYAGVEDEYRPSTGTYELTVTNEDPNAPGTQNSPYTVAQARAAIDAGTGTQGVYATGIVSAIPYAWSTQYNNITFNFVDNAGDTDFLQAYRCVSGTGVDASTVAVGDSVVVYGNLIKYGSTYEFGQGCQLVSLTHPTYPIIIANDINLTYDATSGSIDYTISNPTSATLTATSSADWISNITVGTESVTFTTTANEGDTDRTATITLSYTGAADKIVTVTQAHYVPDYATLPFEWEGGASADFLALNGVTAQGLGSDYASGNTPYLIKFDNTGDYIQIKCDQQPGKVTIGVKMIGGSTTSTITIQGSADGETFTNVEELTISGDLNAMLTLETTNAFAVDVRYVRMLFTKGSNVGVGPISIAKYVEPVLVASITVNPDEVNVDAGEHDGTLDLTYENLTITGMTDFDIQFCDANGDELSEQLDWIEVLVAEQDPTIGEGYVVSYYMLENEGTEARTAYFKVFAMGEEDFVYSNLVTISQAEYVAPPTPGNWELTTLAELTPADVFVIVGDNGSGTYAMSNDKGASNAPLAVEVTVVQGTLSGDIADNIQWNLSISEAGYTFYPVGSTTTWLYCTNSNNGVRVGVGDAKHFTFGEHYEYLTTIETTDQRYIGIYNSQDWRCYTLLNNGNMASNIASQSFAFYKKVTAPVTYYREINAHGATTADGGWYLITPPVASVTPTIANGFLASDDADYDLYYFDQSTDLEWKNYKNNPFNLVSGQGYLYAKAVTDTIWFVGQPYNGNGMVTLSKTDNTGVDFQGWNLIGNPYDVAATITKAYYRMNEYGNEIISDEGTIASMEGIFVIADNDGETVTFTKGNAAANNARIVTEITEGRGSVIDRAIVRFGESNTLPKLQLFENSTKLFIEKNGKDYAIVSAEAQGEMPVNFRAANNGTYTLSINPEGVEMNYLHLIDNMTGLDIDLLQTPNYTFEARTTDYTSRFRLVFGANGASAGSASDETFAYFNGNEWMINNSGDATLQVVDVMGRVLSSEVVSGSVSKTINATPGVYLIRLINGDNIKIQKIVVR